MSTSPVQWVCGFCDKAQIATEENLQRETKYLSIGLSIHGNVGLFYEAVRCLNPICNNVTIKLKFGTSKVGTFTHPGNKIPEHGHFIANEVTSYTLLPDKKYRVQPEYIPNQLRSDYYEACLISDRSPKAAATLARRCLQGMIRDFCGISKSRLIDEIDELHKQAEKGSAPKGVQLETIEAIDAVRKIGNIGAHMERNIDLIVDVDPGEAQALIELIELLF